MSIQVLSALFQRDLRRLTGEIESYALESDLWELRPGISNTAGNLCLHLTGNLRHFIGAVLGNSGYVRDRVNEFAAKNIPRADLLAQIEETTDVVTRVLAQMPETDLQKDFPVEMFGGVQNMGFMLVHLQGHLNYHLGQIDYHRRLISG
ncbi:MAG: DinB family protein [Bacteroidetes bacterium]|nr:MAG: DinB family protein [Bacteroidota bacterium]